MDEIEKFYQNANTYNRNITNEKVFVLSNILNNRCDGPFRRIKNRKRNFIVINALTFDKITT